jgi:hypothetical protein
LLQRAAESREGGESGKCWLVDIGKGAERFTGHAMNYLIVVGFEWNLLLAATVSANEGVGRAAAVIALASLTLPARWQGLLLQHSPATSNWYNIPKE